jgi:Outer membrane protein beta-barrel domain
MKKIFLLITIITCSSFSQKKVQFGLKGGLNIATVFETDADFYQAYKYKTGFTIGGLVEIPLNNYISFQTEIIYSNQGYQYNEKSSSNVNLINYNLDNNASINYLTLPFLLKFYVTKKFSIDGAFQYSILLKHTMLVKQTLGENFYINPSVIIVEDEVVIDKKDLTQKYDIALGIGASYKFSKNIFGTFRYSESFLNINIKSPYDTYDYKKMLFNRVFNLSVGYQFD